MGTDENIVFRSTPKNLLYGSRKFKTSQKRDRQNKIHTTQLN